MKNKSLKSYRSKADKLWYLILIAEHPYCEVCNKPTQQIHHYFHKGSCGHLRYDIRNGIGLCLHCHAVLHFRDAKLIESYIIERRGQKWADDLLLEARKRPTSFSTVKWFRDHYERLQKIYDEM